MLLSTGAGTNRFRQLRSGGGGSGSGGGSGGGGGRQRGRECRGKWHGISGLLRRAVQM
jgi:hypothetical protein